MIHIENLSKTYKSGNKEALKNVSLDIKEGEFTALLGQNGAGKSTLIHVLAFCITGNRSANCLMLFRYPIYCK